MKKILIMSLLSGAFLFSARAQSGEESPFVNYDQFEQLVKEVKEHRKSRLLSIEDFNKKSQKKNTVILDTRSKAMYDAKHIKGAIHLNFADFTQESLDNLLGSKDVAILIYCNNNFEDDIEFFPTKASGPSDRASLDDTTPITLALNIPTYINLYGYGYKNVYELNELISIFDGRVQFEGTEVDDRASN